MRLRFFLRLIHLLENFFLESLGNNKVSATTPIIFGILSNYFCYGTNVSLIFWIFIRRRKNLNIFPSNRRVHFWQSCWKKNYQKCVFLAKYAVLTSLPKRFRSSFESIDKLQICLRSHLLQKVPLDTQNPVSKSILKKFFENPIFFPLFQKFV